jgi:hypothetical protein
MLKGFASIYAKRSRHSAMRSDKGFFYQANA